MVGKDSLERDRLMPWYGEVVSDLYFFRRTVLHGGGVSEAAQRAAWPAAESSNGLQTRLRYARDAELLRFCFCMSQFEMKCIVVSDLLGTNILLNRSVLSARIG